MEKLLSLKPDVVFAWDSSKKTSQEFENTLAKFNIPVVYIRQNSLEDSLEALEIMSEFLGTQQRAKELIAYGQRNLNLVKQSVAKLSNTKKPSVYFAQGNDGLMTECANDIRSEVVNFSGGINPHKCPNLPSGAYKREKITIEQLYKYDPDVIFVREKLFFESIKDLKSWHNLKAYKTNNIYLMPSSPFSWLNRPPSLVRLLGIVWMHHILYKEHFKVDMKKEIADFYKLFLHVELDSNQIDKLLKGE